MNPTSFYSNQKNCVPARPILDPELSEDSDLSSESDESIYISENEGDYGDSSESIESHSQSDFCKSNSKPMVKPKPLLQVKTGASKKTKRHWKKHHWCHSNAFIANFEHVSYRILVFILLTLNR